MRCADCARVLNLGHRYCDCGAVLCNVCRDDHVLACDADGSDNVDGDDVLGLYEHDDGDEDDA